MTVSGLDRLKAKLAKFPQAVKVAAKAANDKSADDLVGLMQRLAPVKTGKLRASIHKEPGATETGVRVAVGLPGVGKKDPGFYGRLVEFGTAPHSLAKGADRSRNKRQDGGPQHPGARPKPFFFPAVRALRKVNKARVGRAAGKAIREVAGQ